MTSSALLREYELGKFYDKWKDYNFGQLDVADARSGRQGTEILIDSMEQMNHHNRKNRRIVVNKTSQEMSISCRNNNLRSNRKYFILMK